MVKISKTKHITKTGQVKNNPKKGVSFDKIVTDKEYVDVKGLTIPKNTTLYVKKKSLIRNPMTNQNEVWYTALVDNGTGSYSLMPETIFKVIM